jgi:hypothetical protein
VEANLSGADLQRCSIAIPSNENKMSDGGRERALLGMKVWKSYQMWSAQRSSVRAIAWLDGWRGFISRLSSQILHDKPK